MKDRNSLHNLGRWPSAFRLHSIYIALVSSLVLHFIVITYAEPKHAQRNILQKPIQLNVLLIKTTAPISVTKSDIVISHAIAATPLPSKIQKLTNKNKSISFAPHNRPPSPDKISNSNLIRKPVVELIESPIDSLPESTALEDKSITTDAKQASLQNVATASTPEPVNLPLNSPNAAPANIGVSIPASYAKSNRKPEYPVMSRRLNEQGTVTLKVLVTESGTAGLVEVKASSNYPLLDESARNAVLKWHFEPARINGVPISEFYSLTIPFKLN